MPAIYLFERRTFLGGDDLQPAVLLALVMRLIQLTLLLGPVFAHVAHESQKNSQDTFSFLNGFFIYLLYDDNPHDDSCRHSHVFGLLLTSYAIASAVYAIGSGILEWRLKRWASIGSPTDTEPRSQKVSYLLELKLLPYSIVLFLVFCLGISMISFAPHYYQCRGEEEQRGNEDDSVETATSVEYYAFYPNQYSNQGYNGNMEQRHFVEDVKLWWITTGLLLVTQLTELLVTWIYLLHLCAEPRSGPGQFYIGEPGAPTSQAMIEQEYNNAIRHELVEEMWAERCASCFQCIGVASCFLFGGREVPGQGDFGDVARALADYLETRGVLDLVPSDIAAGFLVLRRIQRARVYQSMRVIAQQAASLHVPQGDTLSDSAMVEAGERVSLSSSARGGAGDDPLLVPLGQGSTGCQTAGVSDDCVNDQRVATNSNALMDNSSQNQYDNEQFYNELEMGEILNRASLNDMNTLDEGARYAKYALAIYTWVLYLYVHPVTGIPALATKGCFACCRKQGHANDSPGLSPSHPGVEALHHNGRIEGDTLCQVHKMALLLTVGLKEADLVYLQLKSGFRDNPYCILLDHERKSVVVSIRGTFSLEDCVTDVLIEPEPLDQLGQEFGFDAQDQYCHGGVLIWVRNIYRDLQRHQILERLLLGESARYPDYTLRLVGHSLGAAACTILSYMLRPRFPSLRCVNYSPPGCSLSWDLAVNCKEWCSSFVLDSDIVPRLSLDSMESWRDQILELIGRIKVPKSEVVHRFLGSQSINPCDICFDPPLNSVDDSTTFREDISEVLYNEIPDTEYRRQLERFRYIQEERKRSRGDLRAIKLFPPGKMVHLVKTGEKRECLNGAVKCLTCCTTNFGFDYTPIWINNNALNEIIISPHMGTDHFPNRMQQVVESIAKDYGIK